MTLFDLFGQTDSKARGKGTFKIAMVDIPIYKCANLCVYIYIYMDILK